MGFEKNIPEGWKVTGLESCLSSLIDYRGKTPKKSKTGILALSAKSVKMGYIDYSQAYFISPETYKKFMVRGFPKKGDILMTTEAPLGCIAKLDRENITVAQRLLTLRGKTNLLDNDYLMFYLMSRTGQYELKSRASGSTVQGIKRTEFSHVKIILPPLPEQKAIAKILTAFNDKIELLQAQNKTLETMAQTIFKEWFGKHQVGDELPEGWRVGKYSDIIKLSSGKGVKKTEYVDNGKYKIIGANGIIGRLNKFLIQEKVITTGRVGTLGTVFILNQPCWISDNVLINQPSIDHSFYFSYFTLKSFNFSSLNTGSTQPLITQGDLKSVEIIIPNSFILEEFENMSVPFFEKIQINNTQIQSLTKTRDTLLPKLMSGQVRVKNIKQTADA